MSGFNIFLFSAVTSTEKYLSRDEVNNLGLSVSDDIVMAFENAFITLDNSNDPIQVNWLIEDSLFDPVSGRSYICCAVSTDEDMLKTKQTIKITIADIIRKYLSVNSHSCDYMGRAGDINQCTGIIESIITELVDCNNFKK